MSGEPDFVGASIEPELTPKSLIAHMRLTDWINTASTIVIAALTAWNLYYVGGQLYEMKSSGTDTHNLVVATQNLAEAGKTQAASMDKLKSAGEAQATAAQAQARAAQAQADSTASLATSSGRQLAALEATAAASGAQAASMDRLKLAGEGQAAAARIQATAVTSSANATLESARAAARSNEISMQALVAAERPWVGLSAVSISELKVGETLTVTVHVKNTGRGPALQMRGTFMLRPIASGRYEVPVITACSECSQSTFFPNAEWNYAPTISAAEMTTEFVDKIQKGTVVIILFARIDYMDDLGGNHTTSICSEYMANISGFIACRGANAAT